MSALLFPLDASPNINSSRLKAFAMERIPQRVQGVPNALNETQRGKQGTPWTRYGLHSLFIAEFIFLNRIQFYLKEKVRFC